MIRYRRIIIYSILIGMGIFSSASYLKAQPPCEQKILDLADSNTTGYQPRSDSMCEGVYTAPRKGEPSLEMVLLTQGLPKYNLGEDRFLFVDIPGLNELKDLPIRLQAVGREEGVHYRMDAYLPAQGAFVWPLGTVLEKEGIEDFQLGVYGWIESENRRVFLPLSIKTQQSASRALDQIHLIVRTPLRLDWMAWRVAAEKVPFGNFEEIERSDLFASELIVLKIPSGAKGVLKIEVQGKPHNRNRKGNIWLQKTLVFRPGS